MKGKKKYVRKEEKRQPNKIAHQYPDQEQYFSENKSTVMTTSIVKQFNSQSKLIKTQLQAVINNFDDDEDIQQTFTFNFDDKKILHLWLVDILPDSRTNTYKINLSEKLIVGNKLECQMKIKQCQDHIKRYKLKSITNLQQQMQKNTLLFFKINDIKVFNRRVIQDVIQEIEKKFRYKNIKKVLESLGGQHFYLISLKNQLQKGFMQWYQQNSDLKISREDIQISRKRRTSIFLQFKSKQNHHQVFQKPPKKSKAEREQQQLSVQDSESSQQMNKYGFYGFNASQATVKNNQNLSQKESRVVKNNKQIDETQNKKRQYVRKTEVRLEENNNLIRNKQSQNIIFNQIVSKQYLNLNELKNWIKSNKILKYDEFIFSDAGDSMIIKINTTSNEKSKIEAIKIFFKFSKVIRIDTLSTQNRSKVQQRFCIQKRGYVLCKLVQGYIEPHTHEHKLRKLIVQNKIRKSDKCFKKFYAVWIEGLKSQVQKKNEEILNFIQELPKQDKIQNLILDLGKLQKYFNEDRVIDFCKNTIDNHIKKNYSYLNVKEINVFSRKMTLKLMVKHQFDHEYKDNQKEKKLEKQLNGSIYIDEIFDENQLTPQLFDKYLLYHSYQNKGKIVLIQEYNKSTTTAKQIMRQILINKQDMNQFEITFQKGRLQLLKNYIQEINNNDKLKEVLKNNKISFQGQNKLVIFGNKKTAKEIYDVINLYLAKLSDTIKQKTLIVNDIQVGVIEKNMEKFKKQVQNQFKMSFNLSKGIDFGATISISQNKPIDFNDAPFIIFIQKHNHLSKLPHQTICFFQTQRDLNFCYQKMFVQFKAYFNNQKKQALNKRQDNQNEITYFYSQSFLKVEDMFNYVFNSYPYKNNENIKNFAFIMPKTDKCKFILNMINSFQKLMDIKNKIRVYVLQQSQENINGYLGSLQKDYKDLEKSTKYFVFDKKQFYYSKSGQEKIKNALARGKKYVYLTNQDLNLQVITHKCSFNQKKLIHCQSAKETIIQVQKNRYFIELNGNIYQIPDKQVEKVLLQEPQIGWVDVSIGIYELNFEKMQQTNLFSGFTRDLQKKQIGVNKKTNYIQIDLNYKVNQIQVPYQQKQEISAIKACQRLKNLIQGQKIRTQYQLEKIITDSQFQKIKNEARDLDIVAEWDGKTTLTLVYYDKINITNFTKNIKFILSEQKIQIKYPQNWVKIEQSEIKIFVVDKKSKQFEQVQKVFTCGSIIQLVRIQNTYVYKKYFDEKVFLTQLNDGKDLLQLMLFHGTRTTDPRNIYEDKQQSFNINYTSDNNYLGRGTYFAVKSQYSHNYSYVNQNYLPEQNVNILSRFFQSRNSSIRQMFYCSVLVGDSQKIMAIDQKSRGMKDTDYKDINKKIRYQSSTTFTDNSDIYTVYKNRRAYPHYLIRY